MPHNIEEQDLPVLEIVPTEESDEELEKIKKDRAIIDSILEGGNRVELPWVRPHRKEIGQA